MSAPAFIDVTVSGGTTSATGKAPNTVPMDQPYDQEFGRTMFLSVANKRRTEHPDRIL